jgi:hypothetical protein
MGKNFFTLICFFMALLMTGAQAHAAPVAKVAVFPNGEGLEEFLKTIDTSKMIRVEQPDGLVHPIAVVVVPLPEDSHVEVYKAEIDEETFEVRPRHGEYGELRELVAQGFPGNSLLFWCHIPGSIPDVVVVVYTLDEEGGPMEHYWPPDFSGYDGSLVTNDEFIAF